MTTAKATGKVTLFESEGFAPEESAELRLMNEDEILERGLSIKRSNDTDSGRLIAFGSLRCR